MSVRSAAPVALFLASVALAGCSRKPPEPAKVTPPIVTVTHPVVRQVREYEDFAGRTEPIKAVEIRSQVPGYLTKIHFQDGEDVEAGRPLFDIDDRTYKADLGTAVAARASAEARRNKALADEERAQKGTTSGVNAKVDLDQALVDRRVAEADIDKAKADIERAKVYLQYCKIVAPFAGRVSRRMLDEGNSVKVNDTMLTTVVKLDEVYASFDVDERTVIHLLRIVQQAPLSPGASAKELPPEQLQWLLGTTVQVAQADDDETTPPLTGVVTFVDNQIDPGTGTLKVRATIVNKRLNRPPGFTLMPGQFVRVHVPLGPARDAVLVPEKAIGSDQGQRYVYVVRPDKTVERRDVTVGQAHGTLRAVESVEKKKEITPADSVIVEGLLRVRPGVEVTPREDKAKDTKPPAAPTPDGRAKAPASASAAPTDSQTGKK
jgi:multidrug efflux system membrane fusion protein